jgi:HPt (histidine-containing phosphotransfer) domain-containing protein
MILLDKQIYESTGGKSESIPASSVRRGGSLEVLDAGMDSFHTTPSPSLDGLEEMLLDLTTIEEIRQLDPDDSAVFLHQLVELFIVKTGEMLQKPCWSPDSLDLHTVGRTAHSMKSSSSAVGARRFSTLCASLERRICRGQPVNIPQHLAELRSAYLETTEALQRFLAEAGTR